MAGPNSQNQYNPTAITLDGGLDFITPKVAVNGGSLSGCLNFERTDRHGYSRIYGYERFDGGAAPSLAYTNLVYVTHSSITPTSEVRDACWIQGNTPVLGYIFSSTATLSCIAITNFDEWRIALAAVNAGGTIDIETQDGDVLTVSAIESFDEGSGLTGADNLTTARNTLYRSATNVVTDPLPSNKPVIGLHGYKDQLYAIKDLYTIYFENGEEEVFPNDIIWPAAGGSASNQLVVLSVRVDSGNWATNDAAGVLEVRLAEGQSSVVNGAYNVVRPPTDAETLALSVATAPGGTDMSATNASIWRSNSYEQAQEASVAQGWEALDHGYILDFENGTSIGPPVLYNRGVGGSVTTPVTSIVGTGTDGSLPAPNADYTWAVTGAADIETALSTEELTSYIRATINSSNLPIPTNAIIEEFPVISGISGDAAVEVKGVQIEIKARFTFTDEAPHVASITVQPTSSGTLVTGTSPRSGTLPADLNEASQQVVTLTLGGPEDLFGLSSAAMKAALDSNFGFALQPWVSRAPFSGGAYEGIFDIFYAKVTIYLTTTITEYYFWNEVDDVTAKITDVFLADGTWDNGDAEGTLQVVDIAPVGAATRRSIMPGDEIRTAPAGAGLLVAEVATADDAVRFNGLATLAELEEHNSRYQFITANFYANEDFEALYGVNGARRAFTYDGFYFNTIYTQADDAKDKPRHIANHQFHLVLGYKAGSALLSVTGSPRDFNGVLGASEQATGDPITGFARMNGTTLGIFCKDSIHGLVGTSPDNFSLSILSPYEGAIEYTVADVGRPIYCSYRGISLFDQTAAYGSFMGQRLSYPVTPWLSPRLQGIISPVGTTAAAAGPVVAIACRSKNQYRLYFGDGYRLTMTLTGAEQAPMFTIQAEALFSNSGDSGLFRGYIVPRAESSFVDSKGAERIHIAPYSKSVTTTAYHVYEYERSWTFDGKGIPSYIVSNENFFGTPFAYDNARKLRLHGMSYGYAPLTVHVETDYDKNDTKTYDPRTAVDCSLPKVPTSVLQYDLEPFTQIGNLASRGRSFSMRFASYNITTQPSTVKDPINARVSPPFVLQAMLPQYTDNKGDV